VRPGSKFGVLRLARNLFRWFPQKLLSFVFGVLFGDMVESSSSMVSRQSTRQKQLVKGLSTVIPAPNRTGYAVCFSRLWVLTRPRLRLRFAKPLESPRNRNPFRERNARAQLRQNMPDKKQAVQEEVDSDCLFGNCRFQDHQSNGAPAYPERKLSIRWDPSSAACLGSAPLSWQAWIVSETAL
jgi:hypothetical protein